MAIVIMATMTLILGAAAGFVSAGQKSVTSYKSVRADRYAGNAAIDAAVNWAKDNPGVAVDNNYVPGADDACNYQTPPELGAVTVSCVTPNDTNAGVPDYQGMTPPEAMVLTGQRHNEPGPYSWSKCASLWDNISRFFTGDTPGSPEKGLNIRLAQRTSAYGLGSCKDRSRPAPSGGAKSVKIDGTVAAAGKINVAGGMSIQGVGSTAFFARYGCAVGSGSSISPTCNTSVPNRVGADCNTPTTGANCDVGTARDTDPGRITPASGYALGVREAYLPVGFDGNGKLRSGFSLPVRTTAYVYDPGWSTTYARVPPKLKPIAACTDAAAGETIIFLPGWYQDSEVLSRYMSNSACPDRTFWFTPDPHYSEDGGDGLLLTDDDRTGAYYLDFTNTSGRACGDMQGVVPTRWCMGGSAANSGQNLSNSKPRVVVGWPNEWTPLQSIVSGGTGSEGEQGSRVNVTIPTAGMVDGGFLTYWHSLDDAKSMDGAVARYEPCSISIFGWVIYCPSFGQRTLRLKDFAPKVTGGPIGELSAPKGRIFVNVKWGIAGGARMNNPTIVVDALDDDGVEKTCGEFVLPKSGSGHDYDPASGPMPDAASGRNYITTMSTTDAATLATNCGAVANINNYRVTLKWTGNPLNTDNPRFYLDGVKITYDSYQGASFPVGTDGIANSKEKAKSDCNDKKPGAQLIFGGESNVYVADGSLEVCGGPYPGAAGSAASHQVIGIYGVPATQTIRPSSVAIDSGSAGSGSTTLVDPNNAKLIGEPAGASTASATIKYPGKCYGFIGIGPCDPVDGGAKDVLATMPAYSPPAGYRIKRIDARVAYSAEGPFLGFTADSDGAKIKAGACTEDARTTNSELRQWANEGLGSANPLVMYAIDGSGSVVRNCLTPANLAAGAQVRWKTNVPGGWGVVFGGRCFVWVGSCDYTQEDKLDGIELDVTIEPDPAASPAPILKPVSGCAVAHPNYEAGESTPDCALVRADSYNSSDGRESLCLIGCGATLRGQWNGRVSVKGTIYAPSSALEVDDTDVAYPLATRGVVLRQLTISGWGTRQNYNEPAITNSVNKTPAPREGIFTACTQTAARRAAMEQCDASAGDRILTQAKVQFLPATPTSPTANVPVVKWYSDRRMTR